MSRRTYIAMAAVIAAEVGKVNPTVEHTRVLSLETIARGMADVFAADNPRFDRGRFFAACGLDGCGVLRSAER